MKKLKVAFVIQRYGLEVNGGAEEHCRMLAEKMINYWDIEILTSCAKNYLYRFENEYPEGIDIVNNVPVKRFRIDYFRSNENRFAQIDTKVIKRQASPDEELIWLKEIGPYSSSLLSYIHTNHDIYDFFIFFTYLYVTTTLVLPLVKNKAFLIPTAHDEAPIRARFFDNFFSYPLAILFNTKEEMEFVRKRTNGKISRSFILGVGIDAPRKIEPPVLQKFFNIDRDFLLYLGRIQEQKGCKELFDFFMSLSLQIKEKYPLVLIGKKVMPIPNSPYIKHVGFVSNDMKYNILAKATLVIVPSYYESLSLVLLEAWYCQTAVLVNGNCDVLREQCRKSRGGLWYNNYEEFKACLEFLLTHNNIRKQMAKYGKKYLVDNYSWELITRKLINIVKLMINSSA